MVVVLFLWMNLYFEMSWGDAFLWVRKALNVPVNTLPGISGCVACQPFWVILITIKKRGGGAGCSLHGAVAESMSLANDEGFICFESAWGSCMNPCRITKQHEWSFFAWQEAVFDNARSSILDDKKQRLALNQSYRKSLWQHLCCQRLCIFVCYPAGKKPDLVESETVADG